MPVSTPAKPRLALAGGTPVAAKLECPPWPPTDEATAQKLVELYRSRAWSFGGKHELGFAQRYAEFHGARHGVFMVNGTVTLQAALQAVGVRPGDEVIVPGLTWIATAMAAAYIGAVPVFVDIEPDTLCLDPRKVEEAITPRTRAIIPVHLYGSLADMDRFLEIGKKRNIAIIEDCAHMQGGKWAGRGVGSWGQVGSFSFQQSKTVAAGEAGICITSDDALAEKLYRIKHIGYAPATAQGQAASGPPEGLICHNFRATEFVALILDGQLPGLGALIDKYEKSAAVLNAAVKSVEKFGLRAQARGRRAEPQGYYAFAMLVDRGPLAEVPIQVLREAFTAEGLPMGGTYGPVYKHMLWSLPKDKFRIAEGGCPVSDGIATGRSLVFAHPWLGADDSTIQRIAEIIVKVAGAAEELREVAKGRGLM